MSAELKADFHALREFVEKIPVEKLDMRSVFGECKCVIAHSSIAAGWNNFGVHAPVSMSITYDERCSLFAGGHMRASYAEPTGQPAKDEFLKRLDALEAKYCTVEG